MEATRGIFNCGELAVGGIEFLGGYRSRDAVGRP